MVFLDTCIWIELSGVKSPAKQHEIQQAKKASALLNQIYFENESIVTCKERMIEVKISNLI